MKVGVLFPTAFQDPGEYLADARAVEAAGADCLFVEAGGDDDAGQDALTILAALAAVTGRIGLGVAAASAEQARALADDPRLGTVQRLARGRAIVGVGDDQSVVVAGEPWLRVAVPSDRAAWQAALEAAAGEGAAGVLVAADPRLVDLLRHPLEEGDRGDLLISTG
jgi:alkanesulfonate monooxygenase SsuD/methylene tetrahydromethanopterin reductase-like flavin-dependent oxidoreductase (luciferase family)